jgi:hypothetical protein
MRAGFAGGALDKADSFALRLKALNSAKPPPLVPTSVPTYHWEYRGSRGIILGREIQNNIVNIEFLIQPGTD